MTITIQTTCTYGGIKSDHQKRNFMPLNPTVIVSQDKFDQIEEFAVVLWNDQAIITIQTIVEVEFMPPV